VLVANAVEDEGGVMELAKEKTGEKADAAFTYSGAGGDDTHFRASDGAQGPGYYRQIANFPGPPHGLPGYKESHNWVEAFDFFSPLVFDYRWYRVFMTGSTVDAMKMLTEEDLKTDFLAKVKGKKQGECPQGSIWFDANSFFTLFETGVTEFKMGDKGCASIFNYYLTQFVYGNYQDTAIAAGATIVKFPEATASKTGRFPTIATKIFNPSGSSSGGQSQSELVVPVNQGNFVDGLNGGDFRNDNTFAPARHMALAFWMALGAQTEAPNAEMMGYGGRPDDQYFRTGFGCLEMDFASITNNCYFIFVFLTSEKVEYFHTYDDNNFPKLRTSIAGNKWFHVTMILSTIHPGHPGDMVAGADDSAVCPNNKDDTSLCSAILELYVDKLSISIVDWAHGTDTTKAGGTNQAATPGWGVVSPVWSTRVLQVGVELFRRFWLSPPIKVVVSDVPKNHFIYAFPWFGPYDGGLFVCDFTTIPSGNGLFGVAARRELALDALYETMSETVETGCTMPSISPAANGAGLSGSTPGVAATPAGGEE